jgi:hypothetical protein
MRKLIRVLLLVCVCLGCCNIACAQPPNELAGKADKLKANLGELKDVNKVYREKRSKVDTEKLNDLIGEHKREAQALLKEKIRPAYNSFMDAFNNWSVDKAKIQKDMNNLKEQFNRLEKRITDDGEVSDAVDKNLPGILTSLNPMLTFIKSSPPLLTGGEANPTTPIQTEVTPSPTLTPSPANGGDETTSIFSSLWSLIPIFISVAISFGVIFMYKLSIDKQFEDLTQRVSTNQQRQDVNQMEVQNKFITVNQMFNENLNAIKSLQAYNLSALQKDVENLKNRSGGLSHADQNMRPSAQTFVADVPVEKSLSREGSVTDFMSRFAQGGTKAKPAIMPQDALEQTDSDEIYMLFANNNHPHNFLVIPRHSHFRSTQDYLHYSKFYECDQPSSGEVWIVVPAQATYDQQSNQWSLHQRGKLQIK